MHTVHVPYRLATEEIVATMRSARFVIDLIGVHTLRCICLIIINLPASCRVGAAAKARHNNFEMAETTTAFAPGARRKIASTEMVTARSPVPELIVPQPLLPEV